MASNRTLPSKKKKAKKAKVKKTPEEIAKARRQRSLSTKVKNVFKNMGFEFLKTDGIHKVYGGQKGELDNVFLFENIILMVEETISDDKGHIKNKDYFFGKVVDNFSEFLSWLKTDYKNSFDKFDDYKEKNYKFYYLYATDNIIDLAIKDNFDKLVFVDRKILEYFNSVSSAIKYTAKYELFKFLKLEITDIGNPESSLDLKKIETAVIMPEAASGFPEGVQVVTFVMMAKQLMECAYVMRKDSWDTSSGLYQRLLDKKKLENVRKFLSNTKRTFIDSIIVTLPFDTSFSRKKANSNDDEPVDIFETNQFSNISMTIPYKINTIGIIDGQHRVYSHYEGIDSLEKDINRLRTKRHLFVTGLFFDKEKFDEIQKRKLEGDIFLQINNEQKKVSKALLQYIKSLADPYSSIGIGRNVINYLNSTSPFLGLFSDSSLVSGGIKTPSILQWGLQALIDIESDSTTLYKYWIKQGGENVSNELALKEYVNFSGKNLSIYFCAVKEKYSSDWKMKSKKGGILTATMIVAFIRSYKTALEKYDGPKDFKFYQEKFEKLDVDFSLYVSSHWNQLSLKIDEICWD